MTKEWLELTGLGDKGDEVMHVTPGHEFLTADGSFMPIGQMVAKGGGKATVVLADGSLREVSARRIVWSKETAHLFERATAVGVYDGSSALKPQEIEGWQTYNFEVEELHTYIAGGVRVHNDSGWFGELGNSIDAGLDHFGIIGDATGNAISSALHALGHAFNDGDFSGISGSFYGSWGEGNFGLHLGIGSGFNSTGYGGTGAYLNIGQNGCSSGVTCAFPVVIDLDGNGVDIIGLDESQVAFDLDDDGYLEFTAWAGPHDGILMYDANNDGTVTSAAEIAFASLTEGNDTDLEAIAALYDTNNDGVLNHYDADWNKFFIWVDANSNGVVDAGEIQTLAQAGIQSFELQSNPGTQAVLADGSIINGLFDVHMTNGSVHEGADVGFAYIGSGYTQTVDANGDIVFEYESGGTEAQHVMDPGEVAFAFLPYGSPFVGAEGNGLGNVIDGNQAGYDLFIDGGPGHDHLVGGSGNDVLIGGTGHDSLEGDAGNDVLFVDGADFQGAVLIDGGDGFDQLIVTDNTSVTVNLDALDVESVHSGGGYDSFTGTDNNTDYAIDGGGGNDAIFTAGGDDVLVGGNGGDYIVAGAGDDYVSGDAGNDILNGGDGDDEIHGGAGNDTLHGSTGNDILEGGAGNDTLNGNGGDDSYLYAMGDGHDVIKDTGGSDTILLESGIGVQDLHMSIVNGNLVITAGDDGTDSITIDGWANDPNKIEFLKFADGAVINLNNINFGGNHPVMMTDNIVAYYFEHDPDIDSLYDVDWSQDAIHVETIDGINQPLTSGAFYEGGPVDNFAVCYVTSVTVLGITSLNFNMNMNYGAAIFVDGALVLGRDGIHIWNEHHGSVSVGPGTHSIEVYYFANTGNAGLQISYSIDYNGQTGPTLPLTSSAQVAPVWLNGTSANATLTGEVGDDYLIGGSGNEVLFGANGNDTLAGNEGQDTLTGAGGNDIMDAGPNSAGGWQLLNGQLGDDTYLMAADGGSVAIHIQGEGTGQGEDKVVFTDLTLSDMTVSTYNWSGSTYNAWAQQGTALVFSWTQDGVSGQLQIGQLGANIEQLVFADGTTLSNIIVGSTGALTLIGTAGDDLIVGSTGLDKINGGAGDDVLDASTNSAGGWQLLSGQTGDDTYLMAADGGLVAIYVQGEGADQGNDTVVFTDLTLSDMTVSTYNWSGSTNASWAAQGQTLAFSWTQDGVSGQLQIGQLGANIEQLVFADGTTLSNIIVGSTGALTLIGTAGDDLIVGSAGLDKINGGAGDDVLDASTNSTGGWQFLNGQAGDDTYLMAADGGSVAIHIQGEGADQGNDTVVFTDLTLSEMTVSIYDWSSSPYSAWSAQGQTLAFSWTQDGVSGQLQIGQLGANIEQLVFADGTTLSNIIVGSTGALTLIGTAGDDLIVGSTGLDKINGGAGDDVLDGGAGHDFFLFGGNWGHDTIINYENGIDTINFMALASLGLHSVNDLTLQVVSGGTLVSFGDDSILFQGIYSGLDSSNWYFA